MTFEQTVQIFDALGTWFSGLVTLFAIAISYWLGTKSQRVYVRKIMRISQVAEYDRLSPKLVHITIANKNEIPLCLNGMTWALKKESKRVGSLLMLKFHPVSSVMPMTINPGASADFFLNLEDLVGNIDSCWFQRYKFISSRSIRSLRAVISTSNGAEIEIKPPEELLVRLIKENADRKTVK